VKKSVPEKTQNNGTKTTPQKSKNDEKKIFAFKAIKPPKENG
jgi:hypothetical protein